MILTLLIRKLFILSIIPIKIFLNRYKFNNFLIFILLIFFPRTTTLCESIDFDSDISESDIKNKNTNSYYYWFVICSLAIIATGLFFYFTDGKHNVNYQIIHFLSDCTQIVGSELTPQHVIVQLSDTSKNLIHWSNIPFKEIMLMKGSTPVAFLEHPIAFDADPSQVIYKLIDVDTLQNLGIEGSLYS